MTDLQFADEILLQLQEKNPRFHGKKRPPIVRLLGAIASFNMQRSLLGLFGRQR